MSTTLSPPVRILSLVGILAATGLAAGFFLLGHAGGEAGPSASASSPTRPVFQEGPPPAPAPPVANPQSKPQVTANGYPAAVVRALRRHGVAVVVVYTPGGSVDRFVRQEARAGAASARAGFVAVRATNERAVRALVAETGVLPSPGIVVVKRPGVVTAVLGVSDRELVAQAIAQGRR